MDVTPLASEDEGDADSVDQGSNDCEEISNPLVGSNHQETGGAVDGEPSCERDHLQLLREVEFGGEGVGDEEGDALNGEVHRAQCVVSGGFPNLGDDGHEGTVAHREEEIEDREKEDLGLDLIHPVVVEYDEYNCLIIINET